MKNRTSIKRADRVADVLAEMELAKTTAKAIRGKRSHKFRINSAKVRKLDRYKCRFCSFTLCLEVHHILPKSQGGPDEIWNLITLCPNHHALADRGLIAPAEFAKVLARRTHDGRLAEATELIAEVYRDGVAIAADPAKLKEWHDAMDMLLPVRMAEIYGDSQARLSANRDSFPPLPLVVSG